MTNLAQDHTTALPSLEYGTVVRATAEEYRVGTSWGEVACRRAAGCLLQPAPGDTVLTSVNASASYILTVLERGSGTDPVLDLEPGAVIRSRSGDLGLQAAGILNCTARQIEAHSQNTDITSDTVSCTSRIFTVQARVLKSIAEHIDTVAKDLSQRLGSLFRHTKEHEECQAGSKRELVDETLSIQSKNTVLTADEDVRIDGELIHMG